MQPSLPSPSLAEGLHLPKAPDPRVLQLPSGKCVCRSQEGSQFCRGFGGIGGLLRYAVDPTQFEPEEDGLDDQSWGSDSDI